MQLLTSITSNILLETKTHLIHSGGALGRGLVLERPSCLSIPDQEKFCTPESAVCRLLPTALPREQFKSQPPSSEFLALKAVTAFTKTNSCSFNLFLEILLKILSLLIDH